MSLSLSFQLRWLPAHGGLLRRLSLTQCEFLHPQSLNHFAEACPNLTALALYNCMAVDDAMFVGDLPELSPAPSPNLEELSFEGEALGDSLADYLLSSCVD